MIDEKFLIAAINIRKTYVRLLNDLDKYHEKAKETLDSLESIYKKLDNLDKDIKKPENSKNENFSAVNEIMTIINDIEEEGKRLENFTNPINKNIEKLALEEQELYKQICSKHKDMTEDEIIECVKQRLIKENLS